MGDGCRSTPLPGFLEAIHLQVPLQIPCYDLTPLSKAGSNTPRGRALTHPQLRWFDGRCVRQGIFTVPF